ncbi:hypothetical protein RFI_21076, partial [Reticulomyxa filosa]
MHLRSKSSDERGPHYHPRNEEHRYVNGNNQEEGEEKEEEEEEEEKEDDDIDDINDDNDDNEEYSNRLHKS